MTAVGVRGIKFNNGHTKLSRMFKHLLQSAKSKIERAQEHIDELNKCVDRYFETKRHTVEIEDRYDERITVWRYAVTGELPLSFANVIGDCLSNLRPALDNLACAVALRYKNSATDTAFPFGKTQEIFEKAMAKKGKKLPEEAKNFIRDMKPYPMGNNLLWQLHDLNRGDKHHLGLAPVYLDMNGTMGQLIVYKGQVLSVGSRSGSHLIRVSGGMAQSNDKRRPILKKDGLYFAPRVADDFEFLTTTINAEFYLDYRPKFNIALPKIEGLELETAGACLTRMRDLTHSILDTFESRFLS